MSGLAFFDTNILVYADDDRYPDKKRRAIELLADYTRLRKSVISLQVLQEYFAAATAKLHLPSDLVQRKVEVLSRGNVIRFSPHDIVFRD